MKVKIEGNDRGSDERNRHSEMESDDREYVEEIKNE